MNAHWFKVRLLTVTQRVWCIKHSVLKGKWIGISKMKDMRPLVVKYESATKGKDFPTLTKAALIWTKIQ